MSYQGSLAYDMNGAYGLSEEGAASPDLEVVVGGGLDARARATVSVGFVAAVRAVVVVAALLLLLGVARVAITASTVTLLADNSAVRSQITQIEAANDGLRIEKSALSSTSRIVGIATDAYGMVSATDTEQLSLGATGSAETD